MSRKKKPVQPRGRTVFSWLESVSLGVLLEHGLVKFVPVVGVIEVDGVGQNAAVVGDAAGGEDALAGLVAVDVAEDGEVVLVDIGLGELFAVLLHPRFKLRIG